MKTLHGLARTLALSLLTIIPSRADILPDALPSISPFSPGFSELTYHLALTSSEQIKLGDEFVIIDVENFDHWEVPVGVKFDLTVELLTPFSTTFGGGVINPPDDPLKENLRFTFNDAIGVIGPVPFTPLSGLIFDESFQLVLHPNNFAAKAHLIDGLGGLPTLNVASIYVPVAQGNIVPEASTNAAIGGLIAVVGSTLYRRRRSRR